MKGGPIHEQMLDRLERVSRELNAQVSRQAPVRMRTKTGFIDLVVQRGNVRLAIEAEMSPWRVAEDLNKAAALGAWLWLVTPNSRVSEAVRAQLRKLGVRERRPSTCVLCFGQALERLRDFL